MDEQRLNETFIARETLVEGYLLHAYRDVVRVSDGSTSIREWIRHVGAAAVVPLFEDGTTLLLRQFRYPPQRTFWEVPAGKLDVEGEPPEDCGRRELIEETGFAAEEWHHLGTCFPCIGYSNEEIHVFVARKLTAVERPYVAGEVVEPIRLPFVEAVRMAKQGEILDAKTVFALIRAEYFLSTLP